MFRILLCFVLFLLLGCNQRVDNNTLTLNLCDEPTSIDPRKVRYVKDLTFVKQLYDGLMRHNERGLPQKALAKEISVSSDGLIYTFSLRESTWSNGEPLTAHDFERSWKEILSPSYDSGYAYLLYPIKNAAEAKIGRNSLDTVGVTALDAQTLRVELHTPINYFFELLTLPVFFPVHPSGEKERITNGPFKIAGPYKNDTIRIEKNPFYWDADAVSLNEILFTCIKDNHTEFALFEKGQLHWLGLPISHVISTELISKIESEGKLFNYDVAGTHWFAFNTKTPPFDHAALRQAFAMALNREEIISYILQGNERPAHSPLPPSLSLSDVPLPYDPKGALELFEKTLKELNVTRKDFPPLILSYLSSERNRKIVQVIQQQWEKTFSIPILLQGEECQSYFFALKQGKFHIASSDWIADFNDPLAFLELFQFDRGINITGWKNSSFLSELDAIRQATEPTTRKAHLQTAEQILIADMPVIPLYHYSFAFAKNDSLVNVIFSPLGTLDFKYAKLSSPLP